MGVVRILPKSLVSKIAAGEVVERPASIVKELVENSIDAQARRIEVEVERGGRKCIRVRDDGMGMAKEDLELAFQGHATSKISSLEDLFSVETMGFRGEALSSIAAVSQIRAISCPRGSKEGHFVEVIEGKLKESHSCGAPPGTTIEVRNLFFNTPVRAKFLRADSTEMGHITEVMTRMALAFPEIHFSLFHNKQQVFILPPCEDFLLRIRTFFGKELTQGIIPVSEDDGYLGITAFLGPPSLTRANPRGQYVFVNRRFIRDRLILHSIAEGYRDFVEARRYPLVFLFLSLDAREVDVNVHPTKIEVRFRNSAQVHNRLVACIRQALKEKAMPPALAESPPEPGRLEETKKASVRQAIVEFFRGHRPPRGTAIEARSVKPEGEKDQYKESNLIQIHGNYIVEETPSGFNVIDQHALHERILYEEIIENLRKGPLAAQRLLTPETVHLSAKDSALLERMKEALSRLGVEIEGFGGNTILVRSVPQMLAKLQAKEIIEALIDEVSEEELGLEPVVVVEKIAAVLACKGAVKSGQKLSLVEMKSLLSKRNLLRGTVCPHGRPTVLFFSLSDLARQFRRK